MSDGFPGTGGRGPFDPAKDLPRSRSPRIRAVDKDGPVGGLLHFEVNDTDARRPNTFSAEFSLHDDPKFGLKYWDEGLDPSSVTLELWVDVEERDDGPRLSTQLMVGDVDDVSINPERGTVRVSGRDLGRRLLEAKTAESFPNRTTSELVAVLAARHGLTADAVKTTTMISRFWQVDHEHQSGGQFHQATNEWALLAQLARDEGLDLYVRGRTLYLREPPDPSKPTYILRYGMPTETAPWPDVAVQGLEMRRTVALARDLEVVVKSFHSQRGALVVKKARLQRKGGKRDSPPQQYVLIRPNLTDAQAQLLADSTLADLSRHERTISWSAAGDVYLSPRSIVSLSGTSTSFDQTYFVQRVSRRVDAQGGFKMQVTAKNHSTSSEVSR